MRWIRLIAALVGFSSILAAAPIVAERVTGLPSEMPQEFEPTYDGFDYVRRIEKMTT